MQGTYTVRVGDGETIEIIGNPDKVDEVVAVLTAHGKWRDIKHDNILRAVIDRYKPEWHYEAGKRGYECSWCGALIESRHDFNKFGYHKEDCMFVAGIATLARGNENKAVEIRIMSEQVQWVMDQLHCNAKEAEEFCQEFIGNLYATGGLIQSPIR